MVDIIQGAKDDIYLFSTIVSTSGYYWEDEIDKEFFHSPEDVDGITGPIILAKPETREYRAIYPLQDYPTLFTEFARVEPNLNGIIDFTNKYGLIVGEYLTYYHSPIGESSESFNLWEKNILVMKEAVELWEAIKNEDITTLSKFVKWISYSNMDNWPTCFSPSTGQPFYRSLIIAPHHSAFRRIVTGDLLLPARIFLKEIININMQKHPTKVQLHLTADNKIIQNFIPKNLLSAMWFQFSQALTGEKKFKRCIHCGKWEDVTDKKATWKGHPECGNRARVKKASLKKAGE